MKHKELKEEFLQRFFEPESEVGNEVADWWMNKIQDIRTKNKMKKKRKKNKFLAPPIIPFYMGGGSYKKKSKSGQ